jgi:hypothetical protein
VENDDASDVLCIRRRDNVLDGLVNRGRLASGCRLAGALQTFAVWFLALRSVGTAVSSLGLRVVNNRISRVAKLSIMREWYRVQVNQERQPLIFSGVVWYCSYGAFIDFLAAMYLSGSAF